MHVTVPTVNDSSMHVYLSIFIFNLVIIKQNFTHSSGEDVRLLSCDVYVRLPQSFSPHKPHPYSQPSASVHSELPSSNQQSMNRTRSSYIFFFFINQFHLNVHQNMQDMICRYFCFIATLM